MLSVSFIKEDLLQYVWKTKNFDFSSCYTTQGELLEIISFGYHNHGSGPDFFNARIKLNGVLWVGHVEMHISSSLWYTHGHHQDHSYDNVILHVVLEDDKPVMRKNGDPIPCLIMKDIIPPSIFKNYMRLKNSHNWIPCEKLIKDVQHVKFNIWLEKLLIERLEKKVIHIESIFNRCNKDWEQTSFELLLKYMGATGNMLPMELLGRSIKVKIIYKHLNDPEIIEAILMGQAGLLSSHFKDDYPMSLKKHYDFFKKKYNLNPIDPLLWRFGSIRPANFPTIRISQLVNLICQKKSLFQNFISLEDPIKFISSLNVGTSKYFDTHYRFDYKSKKIIKKMGRAFGEMLSINVIAPLIFSYGKYRSDESLKIKAIDLLNAVSPEENRIIKRWKSIGIKSQNASTTQSLIQLKNEYCNKIRCVECTIGHEILKIK